MVYFINISRNISTQEQNQCFTVVGTQHVIQSVMMTDLILLCNAAKILQTVVLHLNKWIYQHLDILAKTTESL